ncbi:MAG: mechanosensitive ion channel protein [Gammaproteobacteria bacterium]|nr:MAG: mechanosensitive ion channel protein [Gammaproteobacteria bacterium]
MTDVIKTKDPAVAAEKISEALNGFESYLPISWQPYWEQLQSIPLLGFFTLLVLGYVLGKLLVFAFSKGFGRIGSETTDKLDDRLISRLKKPLFLTIFFVFIGLGVKTLPISPDTEINLLRILVSIILIVWMLRGFDILGTLLGGLSRVKEKFDIIQPKTIPLFEIIGKVLIIVIGSYILLILWGIDPTAWLASAGVIGIAVGFAAKDSLANLFSGFFILVDSPYKLGDYINLDSGERGEVTHVGLRSTRILTRDDVQITIPNNVIGNTKIVNESGGHWENCRIRIKVGVAYGTDLETVCQVLKDIAVAHEYAIEDPEPRVRMRAFGASGIDFELLLWIPQPALRGRVIHEINMAIYNEFNRLGIEIPYSKRDVYIKQMPKNN